MLRLSKCDGFFYFHPSRHDLGEAPATMLATGVEVDEVEDSKCDNNYLIYPSFESLRMTETNNLYSINPV